VFPPIPDRIGSCLCRLFQPAELGVRALWLRDTSRPTGSSGWFGLGDRCDLCHRPRAAKLVCKDPDLAKERSAVDGA